MENGTPFKDYAWKNRIVVVQTNDLSAKKYREQMKILDADPDGMKDRDLIVFLLSPEGISKNGKMVKSLKKDEVEKFLKISSGQAFSFHLIGKDTGIKLSSESVVTKNKLFSVIDAMPMRKSEMKRKH
jgi:hypothetical protein